MINETSIQKTQWNSVDYQCLKKFGIAYYFFNLRVVGNQFWTQRSSAAGQKFLVANWLTRAVV